MKLEIKYTTTVEGDNAFWTYEYLPDTWIYSDSKYTPIYDIERKKYPICLKTDTFEGKKKDLKKIKKYLKLFFENLLKEKIIEYYKFLDKND
jgi:hypothetical protein